MLNTLITSKTRLKLLLKFFLNPEMKAYLRSLEQEFGESSNAIRVELNRFQEADMLYAAMEGNKKFYQANKEHPLFKDIHSLVRKFVGLDQIVEKIAKRIGNLEAVYLTGDVANGLDTQVIDLIFVGKEIDKVYLVELTEKVEGLIKRHIRFLTFEEQDFKNYCKTLQIPPIILWTVK